MIRVFVGLVVTMGAAGGIDNATDSQLLSCILVAAAGLAILASGVSASNGRAPMVYR